MECSLENRDALDVLDAVSEVQMELIKFNESTIFDKKVLKYDFDSELIHNIFIDLTF